MKDKFIEELHHIVINNISDEKFGVRKLASLIGLSSSQTLRRIKKATGKSVNQYIREIRLKEASLLIKETDLTIAEISYRVGFGSATYFNSTFRKYYGITPGEFKIQNKNVEDLEFSKSNKGVYSFFTIRGIFYLIAIGLFLIASYLFLNTSSFSNNDLTKSIAVLPFKDTSPEDTQWFCDGISDNILTSLSQIEDLSVISFTSSATYRNTDKQIPQIAKELGVSYILEGSVTRYGDNIKITAQLINANDEHVWAHSYDESFENIITIQNKVAKQVMAQMEVTLSPEEEIIFEKFPTENLLAYNLHIKGRLFYDDRRKESIEKNIELNKQAIALDSTFADAYAEIGFSYYLLTHRYSYEIDPIDIRNKADFYADKALEIDPNNYRALGLKACLFRYLDWEKSKEFIERAIASNPNDALNHGLLAAHYDQGPNHNMNNYVEQRSISQKINPLSRIAVANYYRALLASKNVAAADEILEKSKFLFLERYRVLYESFVIAYKNKDWATVIPFFKAKIEDEPDNSLLYFLLAQSYNIYLNDDKNAIKFAKKAYALDSSKTINATLYMKVLMDAKKFEEASVFMQSENYKSIVSESRQLSQLWKYYYLQEDFAKALEVLKNPLFTNQYYQHAFTYAQLGDRRKIDSLNKKHPWGTGSWNSWDRNRAIIHAALKDRDSMYFYLNRLKHSEDVAFINDKIEFDSYRNEEEFKTFLKSHYYPISSE